MPTFVHGKNAKVLIGTYDLTDSFKEFSTTSQIDMAETSAFGNTNKTYIQGLADTSISLQGMFAGGTDEVDDVLSAALGDSSTLPVTIAPNGFGVGKSAFSLASQQSSYEITGSIGDVVAVSSQFASKIDSGGRSGKLLFADAAITATGNQSSVDNAAATTNGGYAMLHIPTNTWDDTVDITIEDSANDSTWATIGTFTQVAASTTATEYIAISGTIRRYVRGVATLATGTGSVTVHVNIVRL